MIKRILVGVCDPQYSASVSLYAVEMAHRCSAQVTVIAVTDMPLLMDVGSTGTGADGDPSELVEQRIEHNETAIRQSIDLIVRRLEEAEIPCRVVKEGRDPYDVLVSASRYHDVMIVGLRGLFEHGVTEEPPIELVRLIESGVRPILAAGPHHREVRRVLIAYSGSVESARTMRDFANLELWPDVEVKVIHFGRLNSEAEILLAEARGYLQDHGFSVETETIDDSPKIRLLESAEQWKADLIVVGNSAKSLLRQRVFGETALHTILVSQVPLFLSE